MKFSARSRIKFTCLNLMPCENQHQLAPDPPTQLIFMVREGGSTAGHDAEVNIIIMLIIMELFIKLVLHETCIRIYYYVSCRTTTCIVLKQIKRCSRLCIQNYFLDQLQISSQLPRVKCVTLFKWLPLLSKHDHVHFTQLSSQIDHETHHDQVKHTCGPLVLLLQAKGVIRLSWTQNTI